MKLSDLGPLEQSILRAVVHAELLGLALTAPVLWRSLPRYETSLPNVEAALAPGGALRGWIDETAGLYACIDRAQIPHGMSGARRRAEGRWARVSPHLRGLGKLPYVESIALVGPLTWGVLNDVTRPVELAVIAEPGRVALARATLAGWRRARPEVGGLLRVSIIYDESELAQADPGTVGALAALPLSPIVDAEGWAAWRTANPWIAATFPNWDPSAPEAPDHTLSDRRDGRLAALRRRVSRRLRRVESALEGRVPGRDPGLHTVVPPDLEAQFEARWKDLASWDVDEPAIPEPPRLMEAPEASPEPAPKPAPSAAEAAPQPTDEPAPKAAVTSRRKRGAKSRPRRGRRSAAAPDGARRGRRS
ncbi:MAG: hypothetical protein GY898_20020 [Proteobacteria bacterium]|nr:hypothetical protein [Pseudomonadota bacterium]